MMKKLVVVLVVLGLAAAGSGHIRSAIAQSPAPSTTIRATSTVQPGREAVIDLERAIAGLHEFNEEQSTLKAKFKEFQQAQEAKLKAGGDKAKVESEIAEALKEVQLAQAVLLHDAFERIRAEIAEYSRQQGIRVVRRSNTIVRPDDKVDVADRMAVTSRFNRPFIYLDEASANNDITDAIVQRLNEKSDRR
jgi:Skp family chaperone for outer membrane proteins